MIEDHPRNPPQIRPQMTTASLAHIYFFAGMHRMTLAVFTRKDFGTEAFNPHGLSAFFILLILGGAYPVMMLYFYAWLITLLWHRYNSYRLRWKGLDGHSRYQGFPWLAMRWPGIKDERARAGPSRSCACSRAWCWSRSANRWACSSSAGSSASGRAWRLMRWWTGSACRR